MLSSMSRPSMTIASVRCFKFQMSAPSGKICLTRARNFLDQKDLPWVSTFPHSLVGVVDALDRIIEDHAYA